MRKGLIKSSLVRFMAPSLPSQGEESCAANLENYRSTILQIWFQCNFQRILDFYIPKEWGSRVLSRYTVGYLTSNDVSCTLPISSSDNLRQTDLHVSGKYSILGKCQQVICDRCLHSIITAWIAMRSRMWHIVQLKKNISLKFSYLPRGPISLTLMNSHWFHCYRYFWEV